MTTHSLIQNNNRTPRQHIVIIGAGMAGTRFAFKLAEEMQATGLSDYAITLLNSEPYAGYNRIMLSPVLAGEKTFADIALYAAEDYVSQGITLHTHATVNAINLKEKTLSIKVASDCDTKSDIDCLNYDKLVFATGSNPFILPLPNHQAQGVFAFRTMQDVDDMLAVAQRQGSRCVVIGGGLLGLEAANALANHGAQVTVVHIGEYVLERQLDATAAQLLQSHFEQKGISFCLTAFSDAIEVDDANQVTGLRLKDGEVIAADGIIMTVGVRPNITLADQTGIACDRGILVDAYMQTQCPDIYAIGECVQFETHLFGLVAPVYAQADVLSRHLIYQLLPAYESNDCSSAATRSAPAPFKITATATKLKVSGVNLFSAGDVFTIETSIANNEEDALAIEFLQYYDLENRIYQKLAIKDDRLIAAVLYGDVTDGAWFFDLIQQQSDISAYRDELLFGQAFCEAAMTEENTDSSASVVNPTTKTHDDKSTIPTTTSSQALSKV